MGSDPLTCATRISVAGTMLMASVLSLHVFCMPVVVARYHHYLIHAMLTPSTSLDISLALARSQSFAKPEFSRVGAGSAAAFLADDDAPPFDPGVLLVTQFHPQALPREDWDQTGDRWENVEMHVGNVVEQ